MEDTAEMILSDFFKQTHYPDIFLREELAEATGLNEKQIQKWFKNRRYQYREGLKKEDAKLAHLSFVDILTDPTYADVILISSDNFEILSYRCLLGNHSKVFKAIFENAHEIPVKIDIKNFDSKTIQAVLAFLCGQTNAIIGCERDVINLANEYDITALKGDLHKSMELNVKATNKKCEVAPSKNISEILKHQKCENKLDETRKEQIIGVREEKIIALREEVLNIPDADDLIKKLAQKIINVLF